MLYVWQILFSQANITHILNIRQLFLSHRIPGPAFVWSRRYFWQTSASVYSHDTNQWDHVTCHVCRIRGDGDFQDFDQLYGSIKEPLSKIQQGPSVQYKPVFRLRCIYRPTVWGWEYQCQHLQLCPCIWRWRQLRLLWCSRCNHVRIFDNFMLSLYVVYILCQTLVFLVFSCFHGNSVF